MITFLELQNKASPAYPAILLDRYSSFSNRKRIRSALFFILGIVFILVVLSADLSKYSFIPEIYANWLLANKMIFRSLFFMIFSFWFTGYLLEAYYLSYYFDDGDIDFDVARLSYLSDKKDLTKGFLRSEIGRYTMLRLGIDGRLLKAFINSKREKVDEFNFELEMNYDDFLSLVDYGRAIYRKDKSFVRFLEENKITEKLFLGAVVWADHEDWRLRNLGRWWVRANLGRLQSIGRNWSFGKTYLLEKFGRPITAEPIYQSLGDKWRIYKNDVIQIENILVKDSGANVMLLSPTSESGLEVVSYLGKMIFSGQVLPELESKRAFVLDTNLLITETGDRAKFEETILSILVQANNAGNVILILPKIATFIENAHQIGVDVASLLAEALVSTKIQVIAITDQKSFHEVVETNFDLMQNFEKIKVKEIDQEIGIRILQEESGYLENKYKIFFTYQSILAIAEGAERYFMATTYSDKILDLLQEVAIKAHAEKNVIVSAEHVYQVLSLKTGVLQGKVSVDEKAKLSLLEETLHKRVIGQNEAIQFIADSMRRGRLGISNPKRPIGSFLFLGPTGVGKTETTKALAESFFESEDNIIRFDMSEYSGPDAVDKLIGSFSSKKTGILAEKIINKPYGVLLLDEFEKTTVEVMDLFLQILDEGQFTDSRGQKIIARNLIIVATSNAASDVIYAASLEKKDLSQYKEKIIDKLIADRIFKPELINRFDGVILFHALLPEHLREVAKLMLRKLDQRLTDKGIKIGITEDLLDYMVTIGNNPKFGARAMNRAIQDEIEKKIADKMIAGDVPEGAHIKFQKTADGSIEITTPPKVV